MHGEMIGSYRLLLTAARYSAEEVEGFLAAAASGQPRSAVLFLERKLGERGLRSEPRCQRNLQTVTNEAFGVTEEQYRKYYPLG
jgi:hypothetical protein